MEKYELEKNIMQEIEMGNIVGMEIYVQGKDDKEKRYVEVRKDFIWQVSFVFKQ